MDALMADPSAVPRLALVAVEGEDVVGHVLFTRADIDGADPPVAAALLAPLAVHPEQQPRGIGGRLIAAGLDALAAAGVDLVLVLGHPGYYPSSGFRPAGALGLAAPYPIPPEHAEAWMVAALRPGVLGAVTGQVRCAAALDDPRHWRE